MAVMKNIFEKSAAYAKKTQLIRLLGVSGGMMKSAEEYRDGKWRKTSCKQWLCPDTTEKRPASEWIRTGLLLVGSIPNPLKNIADAMAARRSGASFGLMYQEKDVRQFDRFACEPSEKKKSYQMRKSNRTMAEQDHVRCAQRSLLLIKLS